MLLTVEKEDDDSFYDDDEGLEGEEEGKEEYAEELGDPVLGGLSLGTEGESSWKKEARKGEGRGGGGSRERNDGPSSLKKDLLKIVRKAKLEKNATRATLINL